MTDEQLQECERIVEAMARKYAGKSTPYLREDLELVGWMAAIEATRQWRDARGDYGRWVVYRVSQRIVDYYRRHNRTRKKPWPIVQPTQFVDEMPDEDKPWTNGVQMAPAVIPDDEPSLIDWDVLLGELDERTRRILRGIYWKGQTLREIGEELSLTAARVHQIKTKALEDLRLRIGPRDAES